MILHNGYIAVGGKTYCLIKTDNRLERLPFKVFESHDTGSCVTPAHGVFAEAANLVVFERKALNKLFSVLRGKVVYTRKTRKLLVTQQRGSSVYLGRKYERAGESLNNKFIFKIIKAGRKAHAVVFRQAEHIGNKSAAKSALTVMRRAVSVADKHVRIRFKPFPKKRGRETLRVADIETVNKHDEFRADLAAFNNRFFKHRYLFGAYIAADKVEFQKPRLVFFNKVDYLTGTLFGVLFRFAETVRTAPIAELYAELSRPFRDF